MPKTPTSRARIRATNARLVRGTTDHVAVDIEITTTALRRFVVHPPRFSRWPARVEWPDDVRAEIEDAARAAARAVLDALPTQGQGGRS
jgi:hypothetical protein